MTKRTDQPYPLTDELARLCLPSAHRDPDRKLAWLNSICLLFLVIGMVGAKPARIRIQSPPPVVEVIPTIVEPPPTPPPPAPPTRVQENTAPTVAEAPQVVVVTAPSPAIQFAVPTLGAIEVPNSMAKAPPLHPLQPPAPVRTAPARLNATGSGGSRPRPPYPTIALEQAEQGTVRVLMTADEEGGILSAQLEQSSGSSILDRATLEFIKRHWTLPPGRGKRLFETSITYRLQID